MFENLVIQPIHVLITVVILFAYIIYWTGKTLIHVARIEEYARNIRDAVVTEIAKIEIRCEREANGGDRCSEKKEP